MTTQQEPGGETTINSKAIRSLVTAKLRSAGVDVGDVQISRRDIHIWLLSADDAVTAEEALDIGVLISGGVADHRPVFHVVRQK